MHSRISFAHSFRFVAGLLSALPLWLSCSEGGSGPTGPGGGGGGPDGERGLLQVSATDLDRSGSLAPAGFEVDEVTSYRVRITGGTSVVIDSVFPGSVATLRREFLVEPNTYAVLVEGFQSGDVLLYTGAASGSVAAGDTTAVAVDLDPALGPVEATIEGGDEAVVATNGTARVRVVVKNGRGQAVSGAAVAVQVEPASAGAVVLDAVETGSDGAVEGTFTPVRRESSGQLRVAVDGFTSAAAMPSFSVVSPVDAQRSSMTLENDFHLRADGESETEIRLRIVDSGGRPQAGIPVVVRSSRNAGSEEVDDIRSAREETDAAGEFVATLSTTSSSILFGDAEISAEADGKLLTATGTISFSSVVSATRVDVHVAPPIVPADGRSEAVVAVLVVDSENRPLPDVFVGLSTKDDSLFEIRPPSGRTNSAGLFVSRISSSNDESTLIHVLADGLQVSDSGFVIFR